MSERLLTAAELADRLALSTSTVLDWFGSGRLPEFKFERVVRFREDEVLDWIEAPARPACPERTTCIGPDRGVCSVGADSGRTPFRARCASRAASGPAAQSPCSEAFALTERRCYERQA